MDNNNNNNNTFKMIFFIIQVVDYLTTRCTRSVGISDWQMQIIIIWNSMKHAQKSRRKRRRLWWSYKASVVGDHFTNVDAPGRVQEGCGDDDEHMHDACLKCIMLDDQWKHRRSSTSSTASSKDTPMCLSSIYLFLLFLSLFAFSHYH